MTNETKCFRCSNQQATDTLESFDGRPAIEVCGDCYEWLTVELPRFQAGRNEAAVAA
jgi:hypothetical protein